MNMMDRFGLTPCPYCSVGLLPWTPGKRIHHCGRCQRPLAVYRGVLQRRRFRIIPLYAAVHATAALLAMVAIIASLVRGSGLGNIVAAIAFPLALFGASDIADGYLSMRTGVHKTFGRVWTGAPARAFGAATIAFGFAGCTIAAIGIAIAA